MLQRTRWILLSALVAVLSTVALTGLVHAAVPRTAGTLRTVPATGAAVVTGAQILIDGPIDMTSQVPQVSLHLSVVNAQGGMVSGLDKSAFTVTEDGAPVDELGITEESVGVGVFVVLDRGGMTQPGVVGKRRWDDAVQLTISFTQYLQPGTDLLGLIAVDAGGNLAPTSTLSYDGTAIAAALDGVGPVTKATALYDGICAALDQFSTHAPEGLQATLALSRKAVVIFADGLDNASTTCTASDVRDRARALGVTLYTVGMDTPEDKRPRTYVPVNPVQLIWLAQQTGGLYFTHVDAGRHEAVLAFFERLLTQRQQYRLSFSTRTLQGPHQLVIRAATPGGALSAQTTFTSSLQLPEVLLTAPHGGLVITRAGNLTTAMPISLAVAIRFPDGIGRAPNKVEYVVNGVVLAAPDTAPFEATWDAARVPTGTYMVEARLYDAWTQAAGPVASNTARVDILPEPPRPPDQSQLALAWLRQNLAAIVCVPGTVFLIIGVVLLNRRLLAGVRKTSLRLAETMPTVFGPARGRLVVTQGSGQGKEFRLVKSLTVIGREQALCDIALEDRYVSARHATLRVDADGNIAITDEGSQNGTLVNGTRIPPRQPIPLPFNATLRMGETEMVLRAAVRTSPPTP
jgi:hypothetical protein